MTKTTLDELSMGQVGRVESVNLEGTMRRRLQDLGLIPGTKVQCTQKSPSGSPTAYLVRETVYALRKDDASQIVVMV